MKQQKNRFLAASTLGFSFIAIVMQVQQNQTSNCWQHVSATAYISNLPEVEIVALRVMAYMGLFIYFWKLYESFSNDFPWYIVISAIIALFCFSLLTCYSMLHGFTHLQYD
jgi:hypothetical protein